ncbi:hypothetical protein LOTGIDRAFT_173947 [Lottia gigantea]|uniref:B box-type domain-containing protein n=1 Tax=Lottia gigantea TaxID=225164 RepID=V4A573_LOTGI|nr:hypothetical protein LOTGIDRAFT_173947 [Lottia gigantea]ESO99068.1 hypothetical protein LOTGIDRAFT_173947 [Lottia gigantea]
MQESRDKLKDTLKDDPMDLIQRNYVVLIEHLDSEQAVDRLFQNFTLTPGETEDMLHVDGAQRKAKMLVTKLRTKSRAQIHQFIDIIKEIQPYLYNIILSNSLHAVGPHFGWLDNNDQDCEPCLEQSKKTLATDWCYQCCEAMCLACAIVHKSMKLLRHHSLKKLSDLKVPAKEGVPTNPNALDNGRQSSNDLLQLISGQNIPLSINGDKESTAGATDVAHLTINGMSVMLVTDWHNEAVKSFTEMGSKTRCKRLKMPGCPFRIAKVSSYQVAVTMSTSCLIFIIKVGIGVLEIETKIKAPHLYDGICYLGSGKFAVSGSSLDIIDTSGTVLSTIDGHPGVERLFSNPDYLTATPDGNIVVSDIQNCRVVCITQTGQIKWIYQSNTDPKLECPHGVYGDKNGKILVCDWDLHTITMLTSGGKFKQILAGASNRVYRPRAVCMDEKCERLFVIQDGIFARSFKITVKS